MTKIKITLTVLFVLALLAVPVYAKTKRPYYPVESGYVEAYVTAGQDALYPVEFVGFDTIPVIVCSTTNQLAYVACQPLSNTNGTIWIKSLEYTGTLKIGWIAVEP